MDTALVFLLLVAIPVLCYGQSDRYIHTYPPYNETDSRTPLTFALLQSFGGPFNSSGAVASVQVALDVINSNPDLLPGYTLHYSLTDTQVKGPISSQVAIGYCNRSLIIYEFSFVMQCPRLSEPRTLFFREIQEAGISVNLLQLNPADKFLDIMSWIEFFLPYLIILGPINV